MPLRTASTSVPDQRSFYVDTNGLGSHSGHNSWRSLAIWMACPRTLLLDGAQ